MFVMSVIFSPLVILLEIAEYLSIFFLNCSCFLACILHFLYTNVFSLIIINFGNMFFIYSASKLIPKCAVLINFCQALGLGKDLRVMFLSTKIYLYKFLEWTADSRKGEGCNHR